MMSSLKGIWASARELGIGSDELHLLCKAVTGEDSLKNLDRSKLTALNNELVRRKAGHSRPTTDNTGKKYETSGMTQAQCKKAFALMYDLASRDREPSSADVAERLCGVIRKVNKKLSGVAQPFAKLDSKDGTKLITVLMKYIDSADKKGKENV
ncbi:MAG: phage protein GemA/Gp16 family protein [Oscillospiraceae bacterium]